MKGGICLSRRAQKWCTARLAKMDRTSVDRHQHELRSLSASGRESAWMEPRLDFTHAATLRKSYVVASSYRCGSTYFCAKLWNTGVLGAPAEYLNIGAGRMTRNTMMARLHVHTPESYFAKLLACRTSKNGVFGVKAHFPHFEAALSWYPPLLSVLSPATYIYVNRKDKLAQAVSMARAMQTDAWQPWEDGMNATVVYNGPLIAQCLRELHQQGHGWLGWFATNNIKPFIVHYEDLIVDYAQVTGNIVDLLEVANDEPEEISLPVLEKQADEINFEWQERFERAAPDWKSWFPLPDL
jgi:LPS sulfotransferase NodH